MMDWLDAFWATYSSVAFGMGVNAMLALSIYLTLSCGLLSLASAAFMGIGAYAAALATMNLGWPFPLALLAGVLLPSVIALIIGLPTLRLSGVYLAMATLGFGEVIRVVILNMTVTGGPLGLNGIEPLTQGWHIALALCVVLYVLGRMRRSRIGRAFEAIKEDEIAARLMGINVTGYKLLAFVLGAGIAGLAGALEAHYSFTISPDNYGFDKAVNLLTMTVFGGVYSLIGPVLGGFFLTILPEALRQLAGYRSVVNGLILVLVVLYLPRGVWDPRRFRLMLLRRRTRKN
jgi:branched-chain amino acid transport system permease protein